ncbi:hypothetical protein Tco_1451603 [Tanacetum coccineum]
MQAARDRQKSYADLKHKPMEFEVGDKVMLKVSPWKGVVRFGKQGKLNPRFFGPFKVIKRVGDVAYKLELGYSKDVHLYVPLRALFPKIHSKDTIATKDELEPFSTFSSRMAALDFLVCDESDVFVTDNNENMAKILAGRRYGLPSKFTASSLMYKTKLTFLIQNQFIH